MLYRAKNGRLALGDTEMDYVSFGSGEEVLIMLPGLGDGLTTVRGMALPLALSYREYARDYKLYIFSRKNALPEGYTTREMAADQAAAMEKLGISRANVLGISQGGMIAQYLAIDHPELVKKLVLAVTSARPNPVLREAVSGWLSMAERGDHKALMIDTAERSYSPKYLKKYRLAYPLLGHLGKPGDYRRFLIQGQACLGHEAYPELGKIQCPTLVIGGRQDRTIGPDAAPEVAAAIKGSRLFIYDDLGHAAYEEAKDFNQRVMDFLNA
ncbi:MAG: alpha/beta fold hydrolase [Candidatus Limivicinus sp.]